MKSKIFKGKVYHKRFTPAEHSFLYKSYFLKISLNELPLISNPFFSVNRFNLFSFYSKDHGYKDQRSLALFARNLLSENGFDSNYDDIIIQTMPRILGYVFNPVSFWHVIKDEKTYAIIAQVNNTFGETCAYVLKPNDNHHKLQKIKIMQVSPFNQIKGYYQFHFTDEKDYQKTDINYFVNGQLTIYATIDGTPNNWNAKNFVKLFLSNPIQNILIIALIHYQALKLFFKKIPFYGKNGVVHD